MATVADTIKKVRIVMNEAGTEESLNLLSEDTLKLDEYIEGVLSDAINLILTIAPSQHLNVTSATSVSVQNKDNVGVAVPPSDYLRLIALKMSGWKRAVHTIAPIGSDEYNIQHNPATRSGANKPSCVLAYSSAGLVIECFPFSGTLEFFHYVKSADGEADKGLGILKKTLLPAVHYMCAALVYEIFDLAHISDRLKNIAFSLIPDYTK